MERSGRCKKQIRCNAKSGIAKKVKKSFHIEATQRDKDPFQGLSNDRNYIGIQ